MPLIDRRPRATRSVLKAMGSARMTLLLSNRRGALAAGSRGRWAGSRGFTLLEVLVVMVIVLILAGVGMPNLLGSIQRYRLRTAANRVATDLRQIQSKAMLAGTRHRFIIVDCTALSSPGTTTCKRYRIEKETWPALTDGTNNANVLTEWINLQQEYGIQVKSLSDSGGTDRADVIFDPRGASTSTGGGSYPLTITVAVPSGAERTVQVRKAGGIRAP